ncbi:unnamed protein product [Mucor hiemalis]
MRMIDPDQIDRAEVVEIKGDEEQREPPSTNNSNTQEPKRKTSVSQSSSENPKPESEEKSQSWQSFEDASNRLKDKLQEFFSAPVVGEDSPVRQERRKNMMDLLQKMLDDQRQMIIKDTE